jgi:hypothetical protein
MTSAGKIGRRLPVGNLAGKRRIVINTSNTAIERGNDISAIRSSALGALRVGFCGIEKYYRRLFTVVADSDADERRRWLEETEGSWTRRSRAACLRREGSVALERRFRSPFATSSL